MLTLGSELRSLHYNAELVVAEMRGELATQVPSNLPTVELNARHLRTAVVPLVRYLRSRRPSCLLSTLDHTNIVAIWSARLASTNTAVIGRQANLLSTSVGSSATAPITFSIAKRVYRKAARFVAVTEAISDELVELANVDQANIRVIPNPVIPRDLATLKGEPVSEPWFSSGEPPVVLGVGRLTAQKNFGGLIRAFSMLRRARRARLVILGEGPERQGLSRLASELGVGQDVSLLGFNPNPYKYMARASVFALSSDWEGLPGTLIQALACGTPLVATDCPTGPGEILAGGRFGMLVPVGDIPALARALERSLDNPLPQPEQVAWRRYTVESAVADYVEVINEVIS